MPNRRYNARPGARRTFITGIAAAGACAAAAPGTAAVHAASSVYTAPPGEGALAKSASRPAIVREFGDPLLEMIRLLHEAAEIEQDLMIQYLYCAFSLKPAYIDARGYGAAGSPDLLGIAVEEMLHLGAVNRLLTELGAPPSLRRSDFPYESDIYPFPFLLERCSQASLAKYMYCEAPEKTFSAGAGRLLRERAYKATGSAARPNFVGRLYGRLIALTHELEGDPLAKHIDWAEKRDALKAIQEEGEEGHFAVFRDMFEGNYPAFAEGAARAGVKNIWELPPEHPEYPSYPVPSGVTAFYGHSGAISEPALMRVAMLGNYAYWLLLAALDMFYRGNAEDGAAYAQEVMLMPLLSIAQYLPGQGAALPFDPLSMSLQFSGDAARNTVLTARLALEADRLEAVCAQENALPEDYPGGFFKEFARRLTEETA